jgi:hypothetical protein
VARQTIELCFKFRIKFETVLSCWKCKKKIETGQLAFAYRKIDRPGLMRGFFWCSCCSEEYEKGKD